LNFDFLDPYLIIIYLVNNTIFKGSDITAKWLLETIHDTDSAHIDNMWFNRGFGDKKDRAWPYYRACLLHKIVQYILMLLITGYYTFFTMC
jgi:hypothetical protein